MWNKSKIDFEQLRKEIKVMSVRSELYKVLRDELTKIGFWKKRQRGKPNYNLKSNKNDRG